MRETKAMDGESAEIRMTETSADPAWEEEEKEAARPRRRRLRGSIELTGTKLKLYGCITMLFYTIGMSVVENGLIHVNQYDSAALSDLLAESSDMMLLAGWASVFQMIGGLAVPVFAFLLVEGFVHTSSFSRYLLTMLGFALISEVPYDLAMNDTLWDLSSQNVLFTLAVCLIMLYALRMLKGKKGIASKLGMVVVVIAAILWNSILHMNFGLCMILLCAAYYLFYDRKGTRILMGCAISTMYVTGPFSAYALWMYNGQRGWNKNKYVFYLFYPLHLLLLGLLSRLIA